MRLSLSVAMLIFGSPWWHSRISGLGRSLLREAIKDKIEQMDPVERKDYGKILDAVRAKELITRQERLESKKVERPIFKG
jgi:hypothetical protein